MVVKKAATRAAAAIVVVVRARMVAVRVVVAVRAAAARVVVARARMEVLRVVMVRATAARVVVAKARVAGEMGDRRNRSNPRPNCHYLSLIQPHSAHVVQSAIRRRGRHLPSLHHRSSQCCQAAPPQPLPYAIGSAAYGMQTYFTSGRGAIPYVRRPQPRTVFSNAFSTDPTRALSTSL